MKAAWYSTHGDARNVLVVGELPTPAPAPGGYERVVPHSDGAGVIDAVGEGVASGRLGQRVWTWNGQWQRPMGTAAEYIVLPESQAVPLPDTTDFAAGACLARIFHRTGPQLERKRMFTRFAACEDQNQLVPPAYA